MPPICFPIKLWNILNSCDNELLRWSDDGTAVLLNEQRFEELIDSYPSFLRQPTLYGLKRLFVVYEFRAEDRNCMETGWSHYSHPCFVRGQPDLLEMFVLTHQTKRYNARAKAGSDSCRRLRKASEEFMGEFITETDDTDDLQPICSSSLFQYTLCGGLDVDSDATAQSPLMINGEHRHMNAVDYSSADCSVNTETEPDVNDVSLCVDDKDQNFDIWMRNMDENEEWFGLKDQPVAVSVSFDFRHHAAVDHAAPTYTNLLQVQHYSDYVSLLSDVNEY